MPGSGPMRILIVDDHPIVREGLHMMISAEHDMEIVGQATNYDEALRIYRAQRPDLTLTDLRLSGKNGIDVLRGIRAIHSSALIVLISTSEGDGDIQRALMAGAAGYALKSMKRDEILGILRTVKAKGRYVAPAVASRLAEFYGDDQLTERELSVLRLVREGLRNKQIAAHLGIADTTVNFHIKNVLEKLQANDRTHAVTIALRRGFLPLA